MLPQRWRMYLTKSRRNARVARRSFGVRSPITRGGRTMSRKNKAPPEPMDKRVFRRGKVWWIRYWHNGHKFQESSRSKDVTVANALLKRKLAEIEVGQFVGPDVNRTTFDDLVKMHRDDYKLNGRRSGERAD